MESVGMVYWVTRHWRFKHLHVGAAGAGFRGRWAAAATPDWSFGGVCYSCLGHREGAYNPCPKWARIYRLMTESGSKAFPASRAPEV